MQDLAVAAEQRYWDGLELLVAGRTTGGVYLMGYAAEMLLKRACFVLDGARPYDPVAPRLGPIRAWARRHLPAIDPEGYHNVWFWSRVLREKRRLAGRPLDAWFDAQFVPRARRIFANWLVAMRYRADAAMPAEARSIYDDLTWLRDHRPALER